MQNGGTSARALRCHSPDHRSIFHYRSRPTGARAAVKFRSWTRCGSQCSCRCQQQESPCWRRQKSNSPSGWYFSRAWVERGVGGSAIGHRHRRHRGGCAAGDLCEKNCVCRGHTIDQIARIGRGLHDLNIVTENANRNGVQRKTTGVDDAACVGTAADNAAVGGVVRDEAVDGGIGSRANSTCADAQKQHTRKK